MQIVALGREIVRRWKISRSLDSIYGVDTIEFVELDELDISSANKKHGTRYQPTPSKVFLKIIGGLRIPFREYTFIDFGSGKGRTLLLASHFPFKKVIGIEFSPELDAIARRNIAHYFSSHQRCKAIEPVFADAADYSLPSGPCVYFFANPFGEEVMRPVLKRIQSQGPSRSILVYYNPVHQHLIGEIGLPQVDVRLISAVFKDWASFRL